MSVKYIFVTGGVVSGLGKGSLPQVWVDFSKREAIRLPCKNLIHILMLTQEL